MYYKLIKSVIDHIRKLYNISHAKLIQEETENLQEIADVTNRLLLSDCLRAWILQHLSSADLHSW
jgi:hemerythrin